MEPTAACAVAQCRHQDAAAHPEALGGFLRDSAAMHDDVRERELSRAGAIIGPAIVGSVVGNAFYAVSYGSGVPSYSTQPDLLHVLGLIASVVAFWKLRDRLSKLSWAVFGLFNAMILLASGRAPSSVLALGYLLCGTMLTISGFRAMARFGALTAATTFTVVAALAFGGRYYADALLGRHSVL